MLAATTDFSPVELKSAIVRDPLTVSPDTAVMDAIAQMSSARTRCHMARTTEGQLDNLHLEARSSCVVVMENEKLAGILTERDVVRLSAKQQPLDRLKIREVMAHPVLTLRESDFTDLFFAINLLQQQRIRHLPILDDRDRLVGLVTHESLRQLSRPIDLLRLRLVEEAMARKVICAPPDSSMLAIVQLMADRRVSSVVLIETAGSPNEKGVRSKVVAEDPPQTPLKKGGSEFSPLFKGGLGGSSDSFFSTGFEHTREKVQIPVGILTERDIVQFQALGLDLESCKAETVISTPIFTVKPDESLLTVQEIMEQRFIRRLAVTGERGELLGIVTQTTLLQALNPLEIYNLAEVLQKKVARLEAEKVALLENRTALLEQKVTARTAALKSKAEREKLFAELAVQIRSSLSLQVILDTTVEQVRQVLGCDRVNIWQFKADWQSVVVAESTDSPLSLMGEKIHDTCFKQNIAEIYRQGHIRIVSDIYATEMSDCHREMLVRLQTRAKILVPLLSGDELWGLLSATESQHPRDWLPEEVELLRSLSIQLAIALQQATTYEQLEQELRERQQAEARLQESKQRYSSLVAAVPVGIFRADAAGHCSYVNDRCCQIAGLSAEAAMGKGWQGGLHPEDRDLVAAEWSESVRDNRPFQLEYRFQSPDGTTTWVYGQSVAERDASGQTVSYVGTITDISDRKQAENALQNLIAGTAATTGQDFFPALVKHIAEALNVSYAIVTELVNEELDVLAFWANGALQPTFSYDPAKTPCERTLQEGTFYCDRSVQQVFPEDLSLVKMEAQSYLGIALRDTNGKAIGSLCILHKKLIQNPQRAEQILQVFAARAAAELERQRAKTLLEKLNHKLEERVRERTEQLRVREAQLQDLFDNANDLIQSVLLENGRFEYINRAWLETLGYSEAEIKELTIFDVLHPDCHSHCRKIIKQMQAGTLSSVQRVELIFITKTNRDIIVEGSINCRLEDDRPVATRAIFRDITERKEAERRLERKAQQERLLGSVTQHMMQSSLKLDEILKATVKEVHQVLQSDRVLVYRVFPQGTGSAIAESVSPGWLKILNIVFPEEFFSKENYDSYARGRVYALNDRDEKKQFILPSLVDFLAEIKVRAKLVVPIVQKQTLWGLLIAHQCDRPRQWQEWEINLLQQIADWLAIAIQQANLYERVQSELQVRQQAEARISLELWRQQTLGAIVQKIRESLDIDEILATVTRQVKELMQGDRVIVFRLFADGRSKIVEEAVLDEFPTLKDRHWDDEIWSLDILDIYWQGKPRIVPDVMDDTWTDCLVEYCIEGQIKSKIVAPVLQEVRSSENHRWVAPGENNKLWGIVSIHACREKRVWQESEAQLLQQLANQLAIAIQQAGLYEQLQQELAERQQAQQQLTERNEQLAVSNEELARATRLKDEFLANMSHELRTPLNAILGMTEGLQEAVFGELNDGQIKALKTIERSGSHLLELINDILDLAKIESGHIELEIASIAVARLCQSSLAFVKQQAQKKRIQLEMKMRLDLPDILGDELRLRQVLINLLNNAVKFTPEEGKIALEVSLSKRPKKQDNADYWPQNYLRIAVSDTGIGIAPENMDKLFKPFIQIDSSLNRQYSGTGLGLSLVKRIVNLHGGEVGVTSELGLGSCFTIYIPCGTDAPSNPEPLPEPEPKIESSQQESKTSPLILLAEDNEANISTVSSYLRAKGYRLIVAKNGEEAIAVARSENPDLILMDIQMPGMDGLEAMQEIRRDRNSADLPIIALTALAMTGDRDRCLAAGANDYLTKPVKLNKLAAAIKELLAAQKDGLL